MSRPYDNYLETYYCIMEENAIPLCGFTTLESAERYRQERGISGNIALFDTRTMEYTAVTQEAKAAQ